ncbi:MAG: hypothetical protein ACUVT8_12760, partial [Armatimonadota bacterium]
IDNDTQQGYEGLYETILHCECALAFSSHSLVAPATLYSDPSGLGNDGSAHHSCTRRQQDNLRASYNSRA